MPRVSRVGVGLGVVVLWLAGLGLLARRELLRPMSARLAAAALQVRPSAHYFVIERNGEIVGGASAEVDTSGYGIVLRQHLFGALLDDADPVVIRARSSYTPTLSFSAFRMELERGDDAFVLTGQRSDDSLLTVAVEGPREGGAVSTHVARDPLFLPPAAALPMMLLETPRAGARALVNVFDPLRRIPRSLPLSMARESVFVVVDSAGFDPETRRWNPARTDTLRAWLVTSDSSALQAWVDRGGAIVHFDDGRGTRAVRTAYEIAFENWRLDRAQAARGR